MVTPERFDLPGDLPEILTLIRSSLNREVQVVVALIAGGRV
jgi:hypothetical protein